MAVPGYQEFMLPILKLAASGKELRMVDVAEPLSAQFNLSDEDREAMLPSGTQTVLYNRLTWAFVYLTKAGLLERPSRGRFAVTPRGVEALKQNPARIDNAFLEKYDEFKAFKTKRRATTAANPETTPLPAINPSITPEEQLEAAYEELRDTLVDDLMKRVRDGTPKFFEHLVVRLLVAMGYGGGSLDRAEVTGKSGDDGIDGVIRQDRLGLDMVYIQAKKWEYTVGPGEIDKFVGSLMRKKANKGVFITSGSFTDGAVRASREAAVKVRLIDGDELAQLMIDFNVGVTAAETYVIKKVDTDFFDDMTL